MKKKIIVLIFQLFPVIAVSTFELAHNPFPKCDFLFSNINSETEKLRNEIKAIRDNYVRINYNLETNDSHGNYSNNLGVEWKWFDDKNFSGKNIIYFGSGPDIFRPLFNFPHVKNIHFLDTWDGWGGSTSAVFEELDNRFTFLAGKKGTVKEKKINEKYKIVTITWLSKEFGPKKVNYHLHEMNYQNLLKVKKVLELIRDNSGLSGIIVSGSPMPRPLVLKHALLDLESGTPLIWSRWSEKPPHGIQKKIFNWIDFINLDNTWIGDITRKLFLEPSEALNEKLRSQGFKIKEDRRTGFRMSTFVFIKH